MAVTLERVPMPERDPEERIKSYDEAILGYSRKLAIEEAQRCIDCKTKPCTYACPALTRAPEYINAIGEGDFDKSLKIALETYPIPGTLGRTCFHPCEDSCVVGIKGEPVAICALKRAAFDHGQWPAIEKPAATGKSVAVVGAGPAGLQVAYDLVRKGHKITVYEWLPVLGGMMHVGIPSYRLPRDVIQKEMEKLQEWGVEFVTGWRLGDDGKTVDVLLQDHDMVFLGVGCHSPKSIRTEGEELKGVSHAVDWLRELELSGNDRDLTDKRIVIIGGGSTAMDVSRNSIRLGAKSVHIVYRRGRRQMTASPEEVVQARDEKIKFLMMANPTRIIGDDNGHVKFVENVQMELGAPDESGRKRPEPIPHSEFLLAADEVVLAVGQNPSEFGTLDGIEITKWGDIVVDENCQTSHERVYSAGDIALGPSSIIEAVAHARRAAQAMHVALSE